MTSRVPKAPYVWIGLAITCVAVAAAPSVSDDPAPQASLLAQRISPKATSEPLGRLLTRLTQETGVELLAEEQLAGRRVVVLARERPLTDVMRQLGRFLGTPPGMATWERQSQKDRLAYRLSEDLASRNARRGVLEKRYQEVKSRFQEALAMADMTDTELAKLRARRPHLVARMPTYRGWFHLVGSLPPDQMERVFRGSPLQLGFSALSADQQEAVRGRVAKIQYARSYTTPAGEKRVETFDGTSEYPKSQLNVRLSGDPQRPGISAMIRVNPETATGHPNLLEPPAPSAGERPAWFDAAVANKPQTRSKRRAQPDDPDLLRRVTVRRSVKIPEGEPDAGKDRSSLTDALRQVAEQTGLPLIADYDPGFQDYYGRMWLNTLKEDLVAMPAGQALDRIAETWDVQWEKKDGWLRVRSPRAVWAALGEIDLSPPWEEPNRDHLQKGGNSQ